MRIVFLTRSLGYGGAERQLVTLAGALHRRGHFVAVLVFYPDDPLCTDLQEARVPVVLLNKCGRWDLPGFLFRLSRQIHRLRPDILHSYLGTPNILAVLLKPMFPHIQMVWGVRASKMELGHYDWLWRLSFQVERKLSCFADLVIVNSRAGMDYLLSNGFPKNKLVLIPNGIDTARFRPDPGARTSVRTELGVSEHEELIGLVGRLDPMKDHPTFLKAGAVLIRERKNMRFACVGVGPADYRRKLQRLGQELGLDKRLIWVDVRDDMPAVYNALDIAVSSSAYGEGFPNVIGEAMACGIPCVVTDVGDSAWIVGDTGIIVPPREPIRLAKGSEQLLNDVKERPGYLSRLARRRIQENFAVSSLVDATDQALAGLM